MIKVNEDLPANANFFHNFIIHPDSLWKSTFDVFILALVAYSCSTNILFITFPIKKGATIDTIYWAVECFFYVDFFLNWFVGFKDIEHHKNVYEFKEIGYRYI